MEPRVLDLLLTLAERPGLTASSDCLIETLWGAAEGSDEALSRAVAKLRTALGDDDRAPRFIETVPMLGYRWIYQPPLPAPKPLPPRWALGPAWVAGCAGLAILVGGGGGLGVYVWAKRAAPLRAAAPKAQMEQPGDGSCVRQVQGARGGGGEADRMPFNLSSRGCGSPLQRRAP